MLLQIEAQPAYNKRPVWQARNDRKASWGKSHDLNGGNQVSMWQSTWLGKICIDKKFLSCIYKTLGPLSWTNYSELNDLHLMGQTPLIGIHERTNAIHELHHSDFESRVWGLREEILRNLGGNPKKKYSRRIDKNNTKPTNNKNKIN